jgi:hypothetical protein
MAGTIIISRGVGLPTGTLLFDYLGENIRARLQSTGQSVIAKAYEPMDEGGMTFITLDELDPLEFAQFLNAVRSSFEAENSAGRDDRHLAAGENCSLSFSETSGILP